MRELTITDNFLDVVKEKKVCIVDFSATWCGPCKKMTPVLEKLSKDFLANLLVLKVNVDTFEDLTHKHKVKEVPTLVFYLNGELTEHTIKGFTEGSEESIRHLVEKLVA